MPSRDSPEVLARVRLELDLVDIVARQMLPLATGSLMTIDDLKSFGNEGLLNAARSYDPSRGVPFRRWANIRIKGAVIDGLRQWSDAPKHVRRALRGIEAGDAILATFDEEDAGMPISSPEVADERLSFYLSSIATATAMGTLTDPNALANAEDMLGSAQMAVLIKEIVAGLPERERELVRRYYFEEQTLDEASSALGLSKSWGSRLHQHAIELIGKELRRRCGD